MRKHSIGQIFTFNIVAVSKSLYQEGNTDGFLTDGLQFNVFFIKTIE